MSKGFPLNLSQTPMKGDLYNEFAEQGTPPSPPTVGYLLLESGGALLKEDGGHILIE
ncbi:MAG: hypothetical protein ACPGVV_01905 [Croceimicrobium sp.]